jgi:hypothetical protein
MIFKKLKPFIEFSFMWLNNLTHVERKESKFILNINFVVPCTSPPGAAAPISHPSYTLGCHRKVKLDFLKNIF